MEIAIAMVLVCALGALLGWWSRESEVRELRLCYAHAKGLEKDANDRLHQAWRDGYVVPATPVDPVEPEEPLVRPLQAIVDEYDDPAAAMRFEAAIRRKLKTGHGVDAILLDHAHGQL